ncbi:MAG: Methyltransferase type 11 [Capsulimonas sp.]|nr:Methyltransferase type 11 [Capsulimonas sp.]
MAWFDIPRVDEPEEIDDPNQPFDEIAVSMGDVARSNRWFGGTHAVVSHVARLLRGAPRGTKIRVLDIATGSGDIPQALIAWGKQRGLCITAVGVDNMPAMLRLAQEAAPEVGLVQADALHLPFPPCSFDIAICALAFHHLGFEASAQLLTAMDALTTRGFIVTDLRRDKLSLIGVDAALALMRSHPFTRHDGPASVRRAFTPREYAKMIALSGVQNVHISSHLYYRMALVQNKSGEPRRWV